MAVYNSSVADSDSTTSTPSSDMILTGGADNTAMLIDSENGAILSKLSGHSKKVTSVALKQGVSGTGLGLVAFTGSSDKTIKVSKGIVTT